MKNRIIYFAVFSVLICLSTINVSAQKKPTKKAVTTKTTQKNSTNTKVKTYKITANSNDNQIFGYVTVVPVDTTTKKNKVQSK